MKQISRRTKTGNFLTLIQGEGLGTGLAIGQLRIASQNEAASRYETDWFVAKTKPMPQIETVWARLLRRLVG